MPLDINQTTLGQTITTRLQVEVTSPGQQPRVIERMMDLPKETADRLRPGNRVKATSNGPKVYITQPIKVVG